MSGIFYSSFRPHALAVLVVFAALAGIQKSASGEEPGLVLAKAWLAQQCTPLIQPYVRLNDGYKQALQRLLDSQTQAAGLDGALMVRKEIELFGDGKHFSAEAFSKRISKDFTALRNLQTTYLNEHGRITAAARAPLQKVLGEYDQRLGSLQDDLTRNGILEEAQTVKDTREKIQQAPDRVINEALQSAASSAPLVDLVSLTLPQAGAQTVYGNLLVIAKGEVEVYHNGRKVVVRNTASHPSHFSTKVPLRDFRAGDAVVLHAKMPHVYRAVAVAIAPDGGGRQIPLKKDDWRFLGIKADAAKITAEEIQASVSPLASGTPDEYGIKDRGSLGITPADQGGSVWVKTIEQLNDWCCIGFVITPEMLQRGK